ncbi:MAG: poly-beta-hydroxybutyrate polymerase N-terminal domain-containing protein, partial [Gammaproteobacteria bacterium]|nr:poly-beta-hydroxybutyrate polymerase N-terminal domain-containing protein [Gammaproteobacteria bacterium]
MTVRANNNNSEHAARSADPPEFGPPNTDSPAQADVERHLRAQLAAVTGGMAPDDYLNAWWEWYLNLATHPQRQTQLAQSAYEKLLDNWQFLARAAGGAPLAPGHEELGFRDAAWNVWPFNVYARTYANWASWWQQALAAPSSPSRDANLSRVGFAGKLLLEAAAPANFLQTNPELLGETVAASGQNLVRGLAHWVEDVQRAVLGAKRSGDAEQFSVGKTIAVTAGKVVYRNR